MGWFTRLLASVRSSTARRRIAAQPPRAYREDLPGDDLIADVQLIRAVVPQWRSHDICFLQRVEIVPGDGIDIGTHTVRLDCLSQTKHVSQRGWPQSSCPFVSIGLEFAGVRDLRLIPFGSGSIQVQGFDLIDIRHRQWERIALEVNDYEDDVLHFYARAVRALAAGPATDMPASRPMAQVFGVK